MKQQIGAARQSTNSMLHTVGTYARSTDARKSSGFAALGIIVLVMAALVSTLYLMQTSNVAIVGYDLRKLERQRLELGIKNEQVRMKIDRLRSLPVIERRASELGMSLPTSVIFVEKPPAPERRFNPSQQPFSSTLIESLPNDAPPAPAEDFLEMLRELIGTSGG